MAKIPAYGGWNDPNAEFNPNPDITKQFKKASEDRRRGPPKYPNSNKHKMGPNPAINYDNNDNWETESTQSVPDNFTRLPPPPGRRKNKDTNLNNSRGSKLSRGHKLPIGYDEDDNWDTESIKSVPDNFTPKSPSVGHNRTDKRETKSNKTVPDSITLRTRQPEGHAHINIRDKGVPDNITLNTRQPEGPARVNIPHINPREPQLLKRPRQPIVGYENNANRIWQAESEKKNPDNFKPQTRLPQGLQLPKGPKPQLAGYDDHITNNREIENKKIIRENFIRPSSSSGENNWQKNQDMPKGPTTRFANDDRIRNVGPAGYNHNKINNLAQPPHDRKPPPSSSEKSNLKPKSGPSAPGFGKWNIDPDCTQDFTKKFAEVRDEMEKRVVAEPNYDSEQPPIYTESPPKINNKKRNWFLDCFRPKVNETHY